MASIYVSGIITVCVVLLCAGTLVPAIPAYVRTKEPAIAGFLFSHSVFTLMVLVGSVGEYMVTIRPDVSSGIITVLLVSGFFTRLLWTHSLVVLSGILFVVGYRKATARFSAPALSAVFAIGVSSASFDPIRNSAVLSPASVSAYAVPAVFLAYVATIGVIRLKIIKEKRTRLLGISSILGAAAGLVQLLPYPARAIRHFALSSDSLIVPVFSRNTDLFRLGIPWLPYLSAVLYAFLREYRLRRVPAAVPVSSGKPGIRAVKPDDCERFGFSPREREILDLILHGYGSDEIGDRLYVPPSAVQSHVRNIYRKTRARNRAKLLRLFPD